MQLELWNASSPASAPPPIRSPRRTPAAHAVAAIVPAPPHFEPCLVPKPECDPELAQLQARALGFVRRARAGATRTAYGGDWKLFEAWCHAQGKVALPATPATLALYLTHLAALGRKYSTIRRAPMAIGQVHCAANLSRPERELEPALQRAQRAEVCAEPAAGDRCATAREPVPFTAGEKHRRVALSST